MGLLDTIASSSIGAPQIGLGGPGMPGAMGQVRDVRTGAPPRAPQRRRAPTYRPAEREDLQLLSEAIAAGMDPSIAASFLQEITGGLDERQDLFRAKQADRREFRQEQMAALPGMAGQAFEMYQGGMDPNAIGSAFSGVKGQAGNRLSDIISGFGPAGPGPTGLDPESANNITAHANDLINQGATLSQARNTIINAGMRHTMGTTPEEIDTAYDLIGQLYRNSPLNPKIDAPLTSAARTVATDTVGVGGTASVGVNNPPSLGGLLMGETNNSVMGDDVRQYKPLSVGGLYERWYENLPGYWPGSPNA